MAKENGTEYSPGDWIVNCYHGVGQIVAIETKQIMDETNTYFRIKMHDGTIWIPVDQIDNDQIRPIVDIDSFQEAVEVLNNPAKEMASNINSRKARIKQVTEKNAPKETARLIRDLRARQRSKSVLSQSGRRALRDLSKRFVQEWAVCKGMTLEEAENRLNRRLGRKRKKATGQSSNGPKSSRKRRHASNPDRLESKDKKWSDWMKKQIAKGA